MSDKVVLRYNGVKPAVLNNTLKRKFPDKTYVFPLFGDRPVDQVDTPEVLNALSKIWLTKPETARRVRQRIGTVLDWAKAAGHRSGDNPINGIAKGLPTQPKKQKHHAALPYLDVNSFVTELAETDANESTRLIGTNSSLF